MNPAKVLKIIYKILIQKCYYKFKKFLGDTEKSLSTYINFKINIFFVER